jgi:small subunit ribosomal protein S7
MSRRKSLNQKSRFCELKPDIKYQNVSVSWFINKMMKCGKKTIAVNLVYDAFDMIATKKKMAPLGIFQQAVRNVSPAVEVKSRRIGGGNYSIPVSISEHRSQSLGLQYLVEAFRKRSEKSMSARIASEIIDASESKGDAMRRRDTLHKTAEANRVFGGYTA